jgi:ABC-type nickel/cobalt efflux system permease component RcnA
MTELISSIYGGIEEVLAMTLVVVIYLYIKIFVHETTNFYSRISALLLCAGATLSILRLAIDGY